MGKLFIITGPSGAGKREVVKRIRQAGVQFHQIVTYTTREKRGNEVDGEAYFFIKEDEFKIKEKNGEFLESTKVHNWMYGSKKDEVEEALRTNESVIIEVDPAGARKIKQTRPNSVTIFIMPPSYEDLKKRLKNKPEEEFKRRIDIGKKELENLLDWDFLVVHEDNRLDRASEDVIRILKENK